MDEARTRGRVACRRLAVSFRQILGLCTHFPNPSLPPSLPPCSYPLLVCTSLRPFARSDRFSLKWFVFDLTTTATSSSGADEGTPFPSVAHASGIGASLLLGKEGRQNVWRNCVLAACIRARETLGGFGDDRRCVVGGGGGASRPLQRWCIAISLCIGWRV